MESKVYRIAIRYAHAGRSSGNVCEIFEALGERRSSENASA